MAKRNSMMAAAAAALGAAAAWGAMAVASCGGGHRHSLGPEPKPPPTLGGKPVCRPRPQRLVDLTHPVRPGVPIVPGGTPFSMTADDGAEGYRAHVFTMGNDTGTHLDAPAHFVEGRPGAAQLPLETLVVPLVVIPVQKKVEANPDYAVRATDLVDWEAIWGPIPLESLVVFNTGWHARFNDPEGYLNRDAEGRMHFPGLSREAAELLVAREVVGVGIDTLSVDSGASEDFAAHRALLAAGFYQLENLTNLGSLPETGARVVVGVLPVVEGTQAPARVLALVDEPLPGEE
ncbi:MAG: cyclase family protein [Myxococcota bacterium]